MSFRKLRDTATQFVRLRFSSRLFLWLIAFLMLLLVIDTLWMVPWSYRSHSTCLLCHGAKTIVSSRLRQTITLNAPTTCIHPKGHLWLPMPSRGILNLFGHNTVVYDNTDRSWVCRATDERVHRALIEGSCGEELIDILVRIKEEDSQGMSGESGPPAFRELLHSCPFD